jgi:hypothetical protein
VAADGQSSRLVLGQIISTGGGHVVIRTRDAIVALDANSLIRGGMVELFSLDGGIGTSAQPLRVDTASGLAAYAKGHIVVTETAGDLQLAAPTAWTAPGAIVSATGDVVLTATAGSILDGIHESARPRTAAEAAAAQADLLRFFGRTYATGSLQYPLSLSLIELLYPQLAFDPAFRTAPVDGETPNVIGRRITLQASGSIGRAAPVQTILMAGGFAAMDAATQELLSRAATRDVIGRSYALYRYTGSATTLDLTAATFTSGPWTKVAPNHIVGMTTLVVPLATGQLVLVERPGVYGLYRFLGTGGTRDLALADYRNTALWQPVLPAFTSAATAAGLTTGALVLDTRTLERLTLQVIDDVDLQATETFDVGTAVTLTLAAGTGAAVQTPGDFELERVTNAANELRLVAGRHIADTGTPTPAITSFGALTLLAGGSVYGTGGPLVMRLAENSPLTAEAVGSIDIRQLSGSETLGGVPRTFSHLLAWSVAAGEDVTLAVVAGDLQLGMVVAGDDATLTASGSILDALQDAKASAGNLRADAATLTATTGTIGTAAKPLETVLRGDLTATANTDVWLHNRRTLAATSVTATTGRIDLLVDGDANLGILTALRGVVYVDAAGGILDAPEDAGLEIDALGAVLRAVTGVGTAANRIETRVARLEAAVTSGGLWLVNTGGLVVGELTALVGIAAATNVEVEAQGALTVNEAIDSAAGPVLLVASTDITVNAPVTSGGGTVTLLARQHVSSRPRARSTPRPRAPDVTITADADANGSGGITWPTARSSTPATASSSSGPTATSSSASCGPPPTSTCSRAPARSATTPSRRSTSST